MADAVTEATRAPVPRARHRPLWLVIVLLAAAAAALWGSAKLAWVAAAVGKPGAPHTPEVLTGGTAVPALLPLAVLSLAAIAAAIATGVRLRRVVGALVVVLGVALAVLATRGAPTHAVDVTDTLTKSGGPSVSLATARAEVPFARALAAFAALADAAAGVLLVLRAEAIPRMGARYSRKPAPLDGEKQLWDALTEGSDPTAGERQATRTRHS
jgi:uncharacterized membrane protein (TIGR02234 family)